MGLAEALSAVMFPSEWSQDFDVVKVNPLDHSTDQKYQEEPVDRRNDG
jgi:hypothetical protein